MCSLEIYILDHLNIAISRWYSLTNCSKAAHTSLAPEGPAEAGEKVKQPVLLSFSFWSWPGSQFSWISNKEAPMSSESGHRK